MSHTNTRLAAALVAAAGALALAAPANAATTYTVNRTDDGASTCDVPSGGECTLRKAVEKVNNTGESATIVLGPGTFVLNSPLSYTNDKTYPDRVVSLSLAGQGPQRTAIALAGGASGSVLSFTGPGLRVLSSLTVQGGNAPGDGGGVFAKNGSLSTSFVRFTGNVAGGTGGGVFAQAVNRLKLDRTTFDENRAVDGSAVLAKGGVATLDNVTLTGNTAANGAALAATSNGGGDVGAVSVDLSTIARNTGAGMASRGADSDIDVGRSIVDQGCVTDGGATFTNNGDNFDAGSSCGFGTDKGSRSGTPVALQDRRYSLAGAGGPPVLIPSPGSVAIDSIPTAGCSPQDARARGASRPIDGNGDGRNLCDAGAVEYEPATRDSKDVSTTANAATVITEVANGDAPVNLRIEYGPTVGYGASTAATPVTYGDAVERVTLGLGGLAAATGYHYRVVASDGAGTFYGPDRVFTTKAGPPAAPAPPVQPPAMTTKLGKLAKLALKSVAKKGFTVTLTCSQVCTVQAQLTIPKKTAKKLGLKSTRLGRTVASSTAAGKVTAKVKLSKKVVRKLRSKRGRKLVKKVTLTVVAIPFTDGVPRVTTKRSVRVKG